MSETVMRIIRWLFRPSDSGTEFFLKQMPLAMILAPLLLPVMVCVLIYDLTKDCNGLD